MKNPYLKETPFSPYALTGDGRRSVAVVRVRGAPIEHGGETLLPATVWAAVGGDPSYRIWDQRRPVKLSAVDVGKRQWSEGELVAIVGGRSRSSRIIDLSHFEAEVIAGALGDRKASGDDAKADALSLLTEDRSDSDRFGFDIGSAGASTGYTPGGKPEDTTAAKLKRAIDAGEVDPSYHDVFRVCCRLLRIHGWRATVEWIEDVYGDDFDAQDTHRRLEAIVEYYSDSFDVESVATASTI